MTIRIRKTKIPIIQVKKIYLRDHISKIIKKLEKRKICK